MSLSGIMTNCGTAHGFDVEMSRGFPEHATNVERAHNKCLFLLSFRFLQENIDTTPEVRCITMTMIWILSENWLLRPLDGRVI
jgi:hypothetical protein